MNGASGVCGVDYMAVSLGFTEFEELHPTCLLGLMRQNAYIGTYQRGIWVKLKPENR